MADTKEMEKKKALGWADIRLVTRLLLHFWYLVFVALAITNPIRNRRLGMVFAINWELIL